MTITISQINDYLLKEYPEYEWQLFQLPNWDGLYINASNKVEHYPDDFSARCTFFIQGTQLDLWENITLKIYDMYKALQILER